MLVSIVCPTYNRAAYLAEAVESVLKQSYKNIELIVVDDCSTDSTPILMEYFCKKDKRVKYIVNRHNEGISCARNIGIKASNGSYIAVMDSDDIMSPDRIKKSLAKLKDCDCVYSSYLQADENGKVYGMVTPKAPAQLNMPEILKSQMIPHVTMVGKKKFFCYKDDYRSNDDMYLVAKMFSEGVKFKKIREPLMIVRYHQNSTSNTKKKDIKRVTDLIKKEFDEKTNN